MPVQVVEPVFSDAEWKRSPYSLHGGGGGASRMHPIPVVRKFSQNTENQIANAVGGHES